MWDIQHASGRFKLHWCWMNTAQSKRCPQIIKATMHWETDIWHSLETLMEPKLQIKVLFGLNQTNWKMNNFLEMVSYWSGIVVRQTLIFSPNFGGNYNQIVKVLLTFKVNIFRIYIAYKLWRQPKEMHETDVCQLGHIYSMHISYGSNTQAHLTSGSCIDGQHLL